MATISRTERTSYTGLLRDWLDRYWITLALLAGVMVLWSIWSAYLNDVGNALFPSPWYVVSRMAANSQEIFTNLQATVTEIAIAFVFAVTLGFIAGLVMSEFPTIRMSVMPTLLILYSIPKAILAPLFIIWFGRSMIGIAIYVSWYAFFPVFINSLTGFSQVPEEFYHLKDSLDASRWQFLKNVKIWTALPHFVGGMKIAVQTAIEGAILAEFIATGTGLGYQILYAVKVGNSGILVGIVLMLMALAGVFYMLIDYLIDVIVPVPLEEVRD